MPNLSHTTIAVVDDDHRVLESVGNLLEAAGANVRLYESAQSLLNNTPDLANIDCLISDIGMPVMDGLELQRLAAVLRPHLPVILLTARQEFRDREGLPANNRGFFQKPFDGHELVIAVSAAIANPP